MGRITGTQVANLPAGGGVGSVKKQDALPDKPDASPIDIAHTIGADYNPRTGKVAGGHTLINGDVRVKEVVTLPDEHGVYEAIVEIKTPDGEWRTKMVGATTTPQHNTMFPKDWDAQRVQAEIESAWAKRTPVANKPNMWEGKSASGITVQGYLEPRTTAFPVRSQDK